MQVLARDLEQARTVGGEVYYPHRLTCLGEPADFAMRLRSVSLGPVMAGLLSYDVEVHIDTTDRLDTAYEVNVPLAGPLECWVGGRRLLGAPNRAVVNGPSTTSTLRGFGAGNPLFGLKVRRDVLESRFPLVFGQDGPVRLRPLVELDAGPGRQWWALTRVLLDAVQDPDGPLTAPMVARPLVDSVLTGLLLVAADDPPRGTADPRPATLRAAEEFIREHAAEPLTVSEIAAASGCGVRCLQEAFRRHLGSTPIDYLRDVRLGLAHADLVAADPERESVTAVASRWGFGHAGRFAAAYRARYRVHPVDTLRAI